MKCEKCSTDNHNILIQGDEEKFICRECTRKEIKQDVMKAGHE